MLILIRLLQQVLLPAIGQIQRGTFKYLTIFLPQSFIQSRQGATTHHKGNAKQTSGTGVGVYAAFSIILLMLLCVITLLLWSAVTFQLQKF